MKILEVIERERWVRGRCGWTETEWHNASIDRIAEAARGFPVLKKVVKPFKPYEWDIFYTCPCGGFNITRDQTYCQHCGAELDWNKEKDA